VALTWACSSLLVKGIWSCCKAQSGREQMEHVVLWQVSHPSYDHPVYALLALDYGHHFITQNRSEAFNKTKDLSKWAACLTLDKTSIV
jgi:hypothetical protein